MTRAKPRFITLEEYAALNPSDLPEGNYELVNGEIIELPAERDLNVMIAGFLFSALLQFIPHYLIRRGTEISVSSRTVTSRYPDLMVLTEDLSTALAGAKRSVVMPSLPVPALIIEVVSPGATNHDRDYVEKRAEYAGRGIPEYWLIDPEAKLVIVFLLKSKDYTGREFRGDDRVVSQAFAQLITAPQILSAGL